MISKSHGQVLRVAVIFHILFASFRDDDAIEMKTMTKVKLKIKMVMALMMTLKSRKKVVLQSILLRCLCSMHGIYLVGVNLMMRCSV